jgi:steroid 5-alpha reductase family enzyme
METNGCVVGAMNISTSIGLFSLLTLLWLISLKAKDSSIVDIFWGLGFVFMAWMLNSFTFKSILVATLVSLWGIRLSGWLAMRNLGKGEDKRYTAMRAKWGSKWPLYSLFIVFYFQGILMCIVSLPVQQVVTSMDSLIGPWDILATMVVLTGIIFESVADWQLKAFKSKPENKGQVITIGLWKYSRHPNYFGDFVVWWGFFCFAVSIGAYWTAIGPAVMSVLLMHVSGVTLLEQTMKSRPGYAEYIARTNAFFPWKPKSP